MRKLWHFGKMCQQKQITAFHQALLIFNFLTQMYTRMVARPPRIGVGTGFDSQGSVTLFHKYCFPNLLWIHDNALEVEDCEFVPVHHQQCDYVEYCRWWKDKTSSLVASLAGTRTHCVSSFSSSHLCTSFKGSLTFIWDLSEIDFNT